MMTAILGMTAGSAQLVGAVDGDPSPTAERPPLIGVVMAGDGPFSAAVACGARFEGAERGAEVIVSAASAWDPRRQTRIVHEHAAAGADAILLQPVHAGRLAPAVETALQAGVRVTLVDGGVRRLPPDVLRVASDNEAIGRDAARLLAEAIDRGGTLIVLTRRGSTTSAARLRGFREELAARLPRARVVTEHSPRGGRPASRHVGAMLSAWPDTVGIFLAAASLVRPTVETLEEAGRAGTPIVAVGAGPSNAQALRDGSVIALIAQSPVEMGRSAVRRTMAALDGERPREDSIADAAVLTAANVDEPSMERFRYDERC